MRRETHIEPFDLSLLTMVLFRVPCYRLFSISNALGLPVAHLHVRGQVVAPLQMAVPSENLTLFFPESSEQVHQIDMLPPSYDEAAWVLEIVRHSFSIDAPGWKATDITYFRCGDTRVELLEQAG